MSMDRPPPPSITAIIRTELGGPVSEPIAAAAEAVWRRHGPAICAILFYGSCRRDTDPGESIVDLYILVDSYRRAHGRCLPALANALLPPNVYYAEARTPSGCVRIKYAVISLDAFRRRATVRAFHPTIWARFSQSATLVYARDAGSAAGVCAALGDAVVTMIKETLPLLPPRFTARQLWVRAFRETYRTELRAEPPGRAEALFEADADRFERLTALLALERPKMLATTNDPDLPYASMLPHRRRLAARLAWPARRAYGKLLSVLRLAKAAFTFAGGVDYILWKIERHSGVRVTASDWQRRHPLLAALTLSWRLYAKGAFR